MEVPVRAAATSEGRISLKKSSNGENKNVVAHFSGEKRCNEERKESDFKDLINSKSNEFSLERKISFKELRKSVEEFEDEPNLTSRKGQVSLVMACKDTLQHDQQNEVPLIKRKEERKQPEGNVKEEPAILHLSEIKIQQWTKVKQNDEEALSRLKQVCGALEGDDIYHYENIDDFDDTTDNYQPRCSHFKRSRLLGPVKQHICCRYKFDKNGRISADVPCNGKFTEEYEKDIRLYLLGEISKGAKTIQCLQKGCTNLYDPWEVVEVVANKAADVWLEKNSNDPRNMKHKSMTLHSILNVKKKKKKSPVLTTARESEPIEKENWWRRKSKTNKIKLLDLLKTCDGRRVPVLGLSVDKAGNSATSEIKVHKVLKYKYECSTCLEGFNDDPESGGLACGHYTCRTCLYYYFKEQMYNMITSIECPRRDCCQRFDTSFILAVLDNMQLRHAYMSLYNKRRVLDNEKGRSKSDETCHQWKKQAASSSEENQEQELTNPEVSKSSSNKADPWLKSSDNYKRCPGCYGMTQKCDVDEECNIVVCSFCRTKFCWNCGEKCNEFLHMYKCPQYGSNKFTKKRIIANYVGYSTGLAVGASVVGTLVIGTGVVALATLIAIGSLSPPVLLSRKMHKYHKLHNSSACRRRLAVVGGAGLGVLALPVLSAWGVYKTVISASKKTAKIMDHLLPPEDNIYPNLKTQSYGPDRDSPDDKNTAH